MDIRSFTLGFLFSMFIHFFLVPMLEKRKQEKEANKIKMAEKVSKAKSLMLLVLNSYISSEVEITVPIMKSIIDFVKYQHPTTDMDFEMMSGRFKVYLSLGGAETVIEGCCKTPQRFIDDDVIYKIQ